eukprot:g5768.t1
MSSTHVEWIAKEDQILREALCLYGLKRWDHVANTVVGRSAEECKARWTHGLNPLSAPRRPWTPADDALLQQTVELVEQMELRNGGTLKPGKWGLVASFLPGRSSKQCRERWHNKLHPDVARVAWTAQEEHALMQLHAQYGNSWAKIAAELPGRTDNSVKNRWHSLLKKQRAGGDAAAQSSVEGAPIPPPVATTAAVRPQGHQERTSPRHILLQQMDRDIAEFDSFDIDISGMSVSPGTAAAFGAPVAPQAASTLLWNLTEVGIGSLTYDDRVTAFAAQGLANRGHNYKTPLVFFDIGKDNYDWPHADRYWRDTLEAQGRAVFAPIGASLCELLAHPAVAASLKGIVVYAGDLDFSPPGPLPSLARQYGDGYSAAIALTLAGQRSLLPVSAATLARRRAGCPALASLPVVLDLRIQLANLTRLQAWGWAIDTLLPHASKSIVYNLNHYRARGDPLPFLGDKQSNATVTSADYAVQQGAFVMDLESHSADPKAGQTAPKNADDALIERVFGAMDPLFDAYGWADDEFSWTNMTSVFGGTIACSFASPNLSFWARMRLEAGAARARRLQEPDRGMALDRSKHYVVFETNEGDTPRVLVSAMCSAWAQPERGSVPVAWAVDPLLAQRFPALFDHFAATAGANDSFVAGTAGAGYAFLDQMGAAKLRAYGERVGQLTAVYGPSILDTYGYANRSVHEAYARAAAAGGAAPAAFVTQPNWDTPQAAPYSPYHCDPDGANVLVTGGSGSGGGGSGGPATPLVCASGDPKLFYYSGSLNPLCPSCDLAKRIQAAARKFAPPHFLLVYGGLQAFGGVETKSKKSFFTLLQDTIARLGDGFVPVGATEMARLVREALNATA